MSLLKKIQAINEQVQEFQGKIDKIGEIVDVVKKVASQVICWR